MKSEGPLKKLLACGVTLLLASAVANSAFAAAGKAVVRAVRGTAQFTENGQTAPLTVGKVLRQGATVETAAESTVDLFLGQNGPVVRVKESSILAIEKLSLTGQDFDTSLNLRSGEMVGHVKKLAENSNYEVKTARSIAGIRGTSFVARGNGGLTCVTGQVIIAWIMGNGQVVTIEVNEGETFVPPEDPNEVPTRENSVIDTPEAEHNAAADAVVASTAISGDGNELAALINELATAAARKAARGAADPQVAAQLAAQAAQAAVNRALNAASAAANEVGGGRGNAIRSTVSRLSGQARQLAINAAATGAALAAADRARNEALARGESESAAEEAGRRAGEQAARDAAIAAGATGREIDTAVDAANNALIGVDLPPPPPPPTVVVTPEPPQPFISPVATGGGGRN